MSPWRQVIDSVPLQRMGSGQLLKSCSFEFLPKNSGNLQIGTLDYFRKVDDDELKDAEEGFLTYHVNFVNEVIVDYSWINDLTFNFFGSISGPDDGNVNNMFHDIMYFPLDMNDDGLPGKMSCDFSRMGVARNSNGSVVLSGSILLKYWPYNCLAFCCHHLPSGYVPTADDKKFANYDAYWSCSIGNRGFLAHAMASVVASAVKPNQLRSHPVLDGLMSFPSDYINVYECNNGNAVDGLNLMYIQYPVSYGERVVNITRQSDIDPGTLKRRIFHSPFLKAGKYSRDCEYRIVFRFVHKKGDFFTEIPFCDDFIRISTSSFSGFIEMQSRVGA